MPKTHIVAWSQQEENAEQIGGDRRVDRRYGLALELKWKLVRRKKTLDSGPGRTVDLSSGGILFEAGRKLPVGLKVQLSICWPVLLQNVAPLQLAVDGKIVRSDNSQVAIQILQHEFRTAGGTESRTTPALSPRTQFVYMNSAIAGGGRPQ